jgi:hypothetical protein
MHIDRLIRKAATSGAKRIVWVFCNLLRPEEAKDAFQECRLILKAMLKGYERRRKEVEDANAKPDSP